MLVDFSDYVLPFPEEWAWFDITPHKEVLRKLNREQYYEAHRWFRVAQRKMLDEMNRQYDIDIIERANYD